MSLNMVNMLGQSVDGASVANGNAAAGYYLWDGPIAGNPWENVCGPLRPGIMVVGDQPGQQVISCNGAVEENQLPDIYLRDPHWKRYVTIFMQMMVAVLSLILIYQLFTRK